MSNVYTCVLFVYLAKGFETEISATIAVAKARKGLYFVLP